MRTTHRNSNYLNELVRGTHPTFWVLVKLSCTERLPEIGENG
ncbi:hypothetical protein [Alysiella crassa]|nr:hypothetical protein [Alysiella crassa]